MALSRTKVTLAEKQLACARKVLNYASDRIESWFKLKKPKLKLETMEKRLDKAMQAWWEARLGEANARVELLDATVNKHETAAAN